jgi:hypothetical protein
MRRPSPRCEPWAVNRRRPSATRHGDRPGARRRRRRARRDSRNRRSRATTAIRPRGLQQRGAGVDAAAGQAHQPQRRGARRSAVACAWSITASRPDTSPAANDVPETMRQPPPGTVVGRSRAGADHAPARHPAAASASRVGHRDHARMRGRKAAARRARIDGRDDLLAMRQRDVDQAAQQQVDRPGQAHVDHLGAALDREAQRLGQAQRVAQRLARADLPARAQRVAGCASGAMPTMPMPLSARAATRPATAVPCTSATQVRPSTKLAWASTACARSGCVSSTPLSMMATRTWRPVATACRSSRCHCVAAGCSAYSGSSVALRAELVHGLRPRHLGMRLQRRDAGVEAGLRRQREHRRNRGPARASPTA